MNRSKILAHFKHADQNIYKVLRSVNLNDWIKPVKPTEYFQKLCREIISQQLAGKAAEAIYGRFVRLMPEGSVTPKHVLAVEDLVLRNAGMAWAKVKYVKDLAQQTQSGSIKLEPLAQLSEEAVIDELIKVKGIGRWTAEMFLIFSLDRENVFSHGDLGLRRGLEKVYDLKDPSREQIEKIISLWSPYKTYGSIALWQSLETA